MTTLPLISRANAALALSLVVTLSACTGPTLTPDQAKPKTSTMLTYPQTTQKPVTDELHGVKLEDPYQWLEDASAPEVQDWMKAQDAFAHSYLTALPNRDTLKSRFESLYYVDAVSAPRRKGDRYFLYRRRADQEKYVLFWKDGEQGQEKVLIDPNTLSEDGSTALGGIWPSQDGKLLAYSLKPNNADEATLYVMDVDTGKSREVDVIEGAKYASPSWLPDNSGFYYTYLPTDPNIPVMERPGYAQIRFHKLGQDPAKDPVVVDKSGNPQLFIGAGLSKDGKHLFLYKQHGWTATDIYHSAIKTPEDLTKPTFAPLAKDIKALFDLSVYKDQLYILTNYQAPRYRVLKVSLDDPRLERAVEIIPEDKEAVIQEMSVVGGKLALTTMNRANNQIKVYDLDGTFKHELKLPTLGATFGVTGDEDHPEAYFSFMSFTVPQQIYKADINSGQTSLWAKVNVPIDPSPYKVEQVFYPSKDGTKVSMFIVTRKDIKRDGSTPFILNGYGGFNVSMKPYFRASIYPWLEAGGGYAVANLRGGGEYGEQWHEDGMLLKKQNVFDDFIAAAEHLQKEGYTSADKLAISGGSNGGLLVGAAMTQRPDLFGAVICAVPLLDMVRYHLFGSGKTWIPEYGSAQDPEQFKAILAYSPYHHIKQGVSYPATLFLSADNDDRVDPLHARKMAAMLQARSGATQEQPILLRIEQNAGHGGGDMVKKWVEQDVDTYSFLFNELFPK